MNARGAAQRTVVLVGAFRRIVPEGGDTLFGSQGGFVDTIGPGPYSLATACLKAFALSDPEVAARYCIELVDLSEPLEIDGEREEVAVSQRDVQRVADLEPDMLGLSGYCWNLNAMAAVAKAVRARSPEAVIVLGGRAAEGDARALFDAIPELNALVLGEGEIPFRELLGCGLRESSPVAGVLWRGAQITAHDAPRAVVEHLDSIPSPYQQNLVSPPPHGMMLELSRGCLNACGYCTWSAHKQLRRLSPERIESEVCWAHERGHRHITLLDSAINYDTPALRCAVDAIRRADPKGSIQFTYNVRHELLTSDQAQILARLPTHMVLCGVETLSVAGMAQVQRTPVDVSKLKSTLQMLSCAVRPAVASIILGLPGDSEQGFTSTLDTLLSWADPDSGQSPFVGAVLVSLLQVYPGCALWKRREELGLRIRETGIPYLLEGPGWSREALARAKADLVRRMAAYPDRLKAAEAIVGMQADEPFASLSPSHVAAMMGPWKRGMQWRGWTLEGIARVRDTGVAVALRFRRRDGTGVRVRLVPRELRDDGHMRTATYALRMDPLSGRAPAADVATQLLRAVHWLIVRNEQQVGSGPVRGSTRARGTDSLK